MPSAPPAITPGYTPSSPSVPAVVSGGFTPGSPSAPIARTANFTPGTPDAPQGISTNPTGGQTGMLVSGALTPDARGWLIPSGIINGKQSYSSDGGQFAPALGKWTHIHWTAAAGGFWVFYTITDNAVAVDYWRSSDNVATPDLVTTWVNQGAAIGTPVFTAATAAGIPAVVSPSYAPGTPTSPLARTGNFTPGTPSVPSVVSGSFTPGSPTAPLARTGDFAAVTPTVPAAVSSAFAPGAPSAPLARTADFTPTTPAAPPVIST